MSLRRAALLVGFAAAPVFAQSPKGTWEGTAYVGGGQAVVVTFDSTDKGWSGYTNTQGESIPLISVTLKADTLAFSLNFSGSAVYISGLIKENSFGGRIWVDNQEAGTIELTKKKESAPPSERSLWGTPKVTEGCLAIRGARYCEN